MNKGFIRRIGDQTVDVQLAGSTAVIPRVKTSGQIDISSLVLGEAVLAGEINGEYIVLHTFDDNLRESSISNANVSLSTNPLLADGTVPLTGNLYVTPGITIDGYDISVLGQAINNLQAADTVARTGWTALTHGTHIVSTVDADAEQILVRDAIFELNEQAAVSNTAGEVEFMRITSAPTITVDGEGVLCYQYDVDRRVQVSPGGLYTAWAAATLINGLTKRGYISIDGRHVNSLNSPNITGAFWVDDPPVTQERVFRLGNLRGILNIQEQDFGIALGALDSETSYILYNASQGQAKLKNVDYLVLDDLDEQIVRIYGQNEDDRLGGDYDFGKLSSIHNSFYGNEPRWGVYRIDDPIIEIDENYSFIKGLLTIGDPVAARITLGEEDNRSIIALRNKYGAVRAVLSTDEDGNAFAHIGNPPPEANSISYDGATNIANVDAHVTMRSASVAGRLEFQSTGEFKIIDPDDPGRFGVTTPRGTYAYTTNSSGETHLIRVDAWGPLVLEDVLGSGTWRTWVGGSQVFGDPRYRHFRIERGATARAGFFNGETPAVYLDVTGKAVFGNPDADNITIDTEGGIRFFNPPEGTTEGLGDGIYEDHMISVWEDTGDTLPVHRISAWRSLDTPEKHTLFLQAQPPSGERARTIISALGDSEAEVVIRAVGGYDTANQQAPTIKLTGYNAEGGGVYTHSRIELDADLTYLKARTSATAPGGTIQNGHILHTNGTYDPGAGAGVYVYHGGYYVPVVLAGDATGWEALDNTDDGSTAGNVRFYTCSASGGSFTINLPTATDKPRDWEYTFYKSDSSANTITISGTINGAASYVLTTQHQSVTLRRAGAAWNVKSTAAINGGVNRIGSTTNYAQFDTTGHLTFVGTAKPWNDILVEPTARNTGANAPAFEKWYDDSGGTSRGVYLYSFDDANAGSEKEVFFTLQMPHSWDGGNIQFHLHWVGAVADTTATPRWGLEYIWREPGGTFGDTTIVYATGNHLSEADITAHKHYITAFTALAPGSTADDLSSVLIGRVFRDSANAADTYNATGAKCGLLYIDAHYQLARIGSNDEYTA